MIASQDHQSRVMHSRNYCSAEAVAVVVAAVAGYLGIHSIEWLVIGTGSELAGRVVWVVVHGNCCLFKDIPSAEFV